MYFCLLVCYVCIQYFLSISDSRNVYSETCTDCEQSKLEVNPDASFYFGDNDDPVSVKWEDKPPVHTEEAKQGIKYVIFS